jgi:hypothetical protein
LKELPEQEVPSDDEGVDLGEEAPEITHEALGRPDKCFGHAL